MVLYVLNIIGFVCLQKYKKINAMKAPFVQFYADATAGEAMEACQDLSDVMAEVKAEFSKIDNK